jgi:hypothetical protein
VSSGVERAAESETTNVPRTNQDAVRLMRLRLNHLVDHDLLS